MTKKIDVPTEYQEACCFVDWLELMKLQGKILDYCHVANESYGGTRADLLRGMKLKRQGRKRGVFDYEIFLPETLTRPACELRVELKRLKAGRISDDQLYWSKIYDKCRITNAICYGADAAIRFVKRYM